MKFRRDIPRGRRTYEKGRIKGKVLHHELQADRFLKQLAEVCDTWDVSPFRMIALAIAKGEELGEREIRDIAHFDLDIDRNL